MINIENLKLELSSNDIEQMYDALIDIGKLHLYEFEDKVREYIGRRLEN